MFSLLVQCKQQLAQRVKMKIELIYSDPEILIINKPAGIPTLPDGWDIDAPYLLKILEADYGRLFVVHRLDKITSGVMVFTRTAESHRALNIQFEHREVDKVYHAICTGDPKWDKHTARHPLRINVGHSHRSVVDNRKGIPAVTTFVVLQRFGGFSLIQAVPGTGRTHQIRVHAGALGFPLLGDTLYSAPETNLISRPALHALSLAFTHPISNTPVFYSAPYPDDFSAALEVLRSALVNNR